MVRRLLRMRIINFMIVGTIGFVINTTIYYLLSLWFHYQVAFLGQVYYLAAYIPAAIFGISFNYVMNRRTTFRDLAVRRMSYLRYLGMCMTTSVLDLTIIFLLVQFGHLFYMLAFVIAVLSMFSVRYCISKYWIWHRAGVIHET